MLKFLMVGLDSEKFRRNDDNEEKIRGIFINSILISNHFILVIKFLEECTKCNTFLENKLFTKNIKPIKSHRAIS